MPLIHKIVGQRKPQPVIDKHPLIPDVGLVGVELELEGVPNPPRIKRWNPIRDGSLRNNGIEYVLAKPEGGKNLLNAIMNADRVLQRVDPECTFRCSTHVHIDARDLTEQQYQKMILAGVYFEDYLFSIMGGDVRAHNTYCPSSTFARGYLNNLSRLFRDDFAGFLRHTDWCKYTPMNLKTTMTLGSIEFRGSEAKFTSGVLLRLVCRYMHLKRIAMEHEGTHVEFIDFMFNSKPEDIFGNAAPAWVSMTDADKMNSKVKCLDLLFFRR